MTVATAIDNSAARRAMIDSQLRVSGVTQDFVLAVMGETAREDYVPAAARGHAYIDRAIALGGGRALPAPLVHGLLLREAANIWLNEEGYLDVFPVASILGPRQCGKTTGGTAAPSAWAPWTAAFVRRLHELGWIERYPC